MGRRSILYTYIVSHNIIESKTMLYNTRIAPSPTGIFHIGTARTAYFNYLAARGSGGKFILRIDDTDTARNNEDHVKTIYESMDWLGLDYDITFRQSDRNDIYREMAQHLIRVDKAQLIDGAVFLKTDSVITEWDDLIAGKIVITDKANQDVNKMVLMKSDGTPSYHFATVIDDIQYGINLVIRGTDHISNTIKHAYIYDALGAPMPYYAHVGLIHQGGKKISKRDGTGALSFYQENGYLPEAVLNSLLMLGWGHPDPSFDKKYPTVDKQSAIKLFPEGKMRSAPSSLNMPKLDWLNKRYHNKQFQKDKLNEEKRNST
jgi:glutamyl-tRNA synthetase